MIHIIIKDGVVTVETNDPEQTTVVISNFDKLMFGAVQPTYNEYLDKKFKA